MNDGEKHMKNWRISSIRRNNCNGLVLGTFLFLLVVSLILSLCFGAAMIPPGTVWNVFAGREKGTSAANIILLVRLPRTAACLFAGMALAVSGVILQNTLLNPMAAPSVIGVNAGAGFAMALVSAFSFTAISPAEASICAFSGALAAALLVLFIAEKTGASRLTLILSGVAVSNILNAGTDAVITFAPDALNGYAGFRIGGLDNLTMARILPAAGIILTAFLLTLSLSNELEVLSLGTDTARSLGLPAKKIRLIFLTLAAALAGAAVSFAGSMGFIGLIVPHVMKKTVGTEARILIPASALGGALFLTVCDLLSRILFAPYEVPVGILLSFLGGPFFLWLLFRQKGGRIHD